ncbi:quinone-dependent dihydroorotate dehydrogenase [Brevibacillus humidisoli]|uniref:quinone-dependent dihydroorotate dehydrogenase n=1 Tax=Brevibacillus humidisoli TaxID=2895522 RepID=UPI001E5835AB|nr:quinone-dependent dihydroorotate dehydrogenase [Brevibacillus humidisoli]UFJ39774.1 quinone-dependent dihydroorotate dehydrogenase [Brevibacillus humidisoli]
MYQLMKRFLFRLDPEAAHEQVTGALRFASRAPGGKQVLQLMYGYHDKRLETRLWGTRFPNPVGLAAGFDKNAEVYHALAALGFGFVEVGTITPVAQQGNERPRLFRLIEDEAVINRMGFNNLGADHAAQNLSRYAAANVPIGINIGKNKHTPNEEAARDYETCLDTLYPYGHYFVVNVSSPNTPNLRDLQQTESLRKLLEAIKIKKDEWVQRGEPSKPILLKVAPDMTDEQMRDVIQVALDVGLDGIVATNTTLSREGLRDAETSRQAGGLSGRPLTARSTEWIREIRQEVGDKLPIIGVGGIFDGDDAYAKIRAGADLVQVYTGMIYQGPGIVQAINKRLIQLLERDGFSSVEQAVGADAR